MDEAALSWRDLRELLSRRELRQELTAMVRQGHGAGIARLDTGRLRMRFPCRLHVVLRSGRTLDVDGEERGASGAAVEEQRGVLAEKCAAVGLSADLVGDDSLRDEVAVRVGHVDVDEAEAAAPLDHLGDRAEVGAARGAQELDREADGRPGAQH